MGYSLNDEWTEFHKAIPVHQLTTAQRALLEIVTDDTNSQWQRGVAAAALAYMVDKADEHGQFCKQNGVVRDHFECGYAAGFAEAASWMRHSQDDEAD